MVTQSEPQSNIVRRHASQSIELDSVDRDILRLLASDARLPNNSVASSVGIAPSTCLMRIRRLQDARVITAYRTEIALEPLGRPLQALVSVRLQAHARSRIGDFATRFAALPGVLNVFFLSGVNDFLVHVASASPDDLRNFVVRNLSATRDIAGTETSLIFEHISTGSEAVLGRSTDAAIVPSAIGRGESADGI